MPKAQPMHVELLFAPVALDHVPDGHWTHVELLDALTFVENVPPGHMVQMEVPSLSEYEPALHGMHAEALLADRAAENVPAGHFEQKDAAPDSENVPCTQDAQMVDPLNAENEPGLQEGHADRCADSTNPDTLEKVPGKQGMHASPAD